jgi:hypothetical protein
MSKPAVCISFRLSTHLPDIMAPIKPSKQTQILLDTMSKSADEEKSFMNQVMDQFDLLFTRVNDIGEMQQ